MAGSWLDSLEAEARVRLPPAVFEYVAQGARDGSTAARAVQAWRELAFEPHVLRDVSTVDAGTTLLGTRVASPVGIAPTTLQRAADPCGEVAMATAAAAAGSLLVLSSNSGSRFTDIADTGVHWWLQAYLPQTRDRARPMLESAVDSGARAVVLTLDTPVVGTKYHDGAPVWDDVPAGWLRVNLGEAGDDPKAMDLGPADIGWLRDVTGLPVAVKGVLRPDDARRCVQAGAAAVWVSNHGGRQLDRATTTADALPAVVSALGGEVEVYVDGGLRNGLDLLAALGLGADAGFFGRQPWYALAAGGEDGVARFCAELSSELVEAMTLAGCPDLPATRTLIHGSERLSTP